MHCKLHVSWIWVLRIEIYTIARNLCGEKIRWNCADNENNFLLSKTDQWRTQSCVPSYLTFLVNTLVRSFVVQMWGSRNPRIILKLIIAILEYSYDALRKLITNYARFSFFFLGKISAQLHTIVKQIYFPSGSVLFLSLFSLSKNWMHVV